VARTAEATGTVSTDAIRILALGAAAAGLAPPAFCARFGLDPATLADVDGRVPAATVARLWVDVDVVVVVNVNLNDLGPSPDPLAMAHDDKHGGAAGQDARPPPGVGSP